MHKHRLIFHTHKQQNSIHINTQHKKKDNQTKSNKTKHKQKLFNLKNFVFAPKMTHKSKHKNKYKQNKNPTKMQEHIETQT